MISVLAIEDLSVRFRTARGDATILENIDLHVPQGRIVGIVGESGSGKSVLARTIMRIVPNDLVSQITGKITLDGHDLLRLSEQRMRDIRGRRVSIVFQDPTTSLNPVMTVGEQIAETVRDRLGLSRRAAHERAVELLAELSVPDPRRRAAQYPHEMSGGMKQRVALAIALSCEPRLLIADEPTTSLDATVQVQILELLRREQVRRGMSVLLISHDLGIMAHFTDWIHVMYGGRILEAAATPDIFHRPRVRYTEALLRSVPRLDEPLTRELRAIPGHPPSVFERPPGCPFQARCEFSEALCRSSIPQLESAGDTHRFACWSPVPPGDSTRLKPGSS